ncbi:MAG: 3-hydroxyacyl-CoA dehydrogenase/enoyl-CoA hydratase family protein [Deltaproteobacteria bacterium]|nr:3-hydroxyacyl-CoA dehydrogenase/enoyl-CoA hydratase family protein [Deltaproteobacteria bacterium]
MVRARIDRVGVLGAGIMGTGIACHLANAGAEVVLLDIPPPDGKGGRNAFAIRAMELALKANPKPLFHPTRAERIAVGNLEDDLQKLSSCQWVVEAVKEDLGVKRALFARVEEVIGPDTIVSSNTSGIPLAAMVEGRSEAFRKHFLITHFFNPVRYMKLLEIISGPGTDPKAVEILATYVSDTLGKGVVYAKDTPNFIANRIGTYGMMRVMNEMDAQDATIEEIDAIFSRPLGRPKSAVFNTGDLVGIDLLLAVAQHCHEGLPNDPQRAIYETPEWVKDLVRRGQLGRKTPDKGGFFKKADKTPDNPKGLVVWDRKTQAYRPSGKIRIDSLGAAKSIDDLGERLRTVVFANDRAGRIAWPCIRDTLLYSARLLGEIADDVHSIDNAMKWGFAWDSGPFETWDLLGFRKVVEKMKADGATLPAWVAKAYDAGAQSIYGSQPAAFATDPRRASLADRKKAGAKIIKSNFGASLVDLGDEVAALELHTKANAIDADVGQMLVDSIDWAESNGRGLVIYNEGDNFSVGANLMVIYLLAQQKDWVQLEAAVNQLQQALQRIRYARVPVVAAPHQMALGGGCEICLAAGSGAGLVPTAELYMGLVEVGVGVIPAAGGVTNSVFGAMERITEGAELDPLPILGQVFKQIATAQVATSAEEARALGYVPLTARISMDRRRQLHDAKQLVIGLFESGYRPPLSRSFKLPGESGIATMGTMVRSMVAGGYATEHDAKISMGLAKVVCGGAAGHTRKVTEQQMLDLEREVFLSLAGEEKSQARMASILTTNKPLRN